MIRFGMNKKTLDAINPDFLFYMKQNGKYQPVDLQVNERS